MIKCRPNAAVAHKYDHDLNNLPKNGLCRPNALFYMIKCCLNAAVAHKPDYDLFKLSKMVYVALIRIVALMLYCT